ncbi:MAG: HAD hydrolase-like protein [Elusimicrobia bacterium]|nr:HAD hydrolase-like protein [Elusimicrobiota bacterium]MDE2511779.1 HAD hydrolase-like protein [Elusimicrobiota bacterium]
MKVLLFDIDGTLIRGGGAGRKALNRAGEVLYGVRNCCSELSLAGRTDLYNFGAAHQYATGRKPARRDVDRLHREYLKHLPYYVKKALRGGTYHIPPGLKVLLKRLSRDKRVLLGLGTGNMEKGARIKLEPSGFNEYFQFGGYGSDSFHRHALLKKAVRRAKKMTKERFTNGDVYVIGDTPFDVAAGRKAGFKTVGVGTGFSEWRELAASKPDHLARDFRNTKKWLNWFELS